MSTPHDNSQSLFNVHQILKVKPNFKCICCSTEDTGTSYMLIVKHVLTGLQKSCPTGGTWVSHMWSIKG